MANVESPPTAQSSSSTLRAHFFCIAACFLHMSTSCVYAWTSPSLPLLVKEGVLTDDQGSWITSLVAFGASFGPILTYFSLDRVGRKGSLWGITATYIIGWLILGLTQNVYVMCGARLFIGIGVGTAFIVVSVYISEIADDKSRNVMNTFIQMFFGCGFLIEYAIGPHVSYTLLLVLSCAPACIFAVVLVFAPETPQYLLARGNKARAIETLSKLRKADLVQIQAEIDRMEMALTEAKLAKEKKSNLFFKPGPRKALILSVILLTAQQVGGYNIIIGYTEKIFTLAQASLDSETSSIMFAVCTIFSTFIAAPIIRKFGLKPALLLSIFGAITCNALLALYFGLKDHGVDVSSLGYLPVISIMAESVLFAVGLSGLPWAAVAEVFSRGLIAFASCVAGVYSGLCSFVVMKIAVDILNNSGMFLVLMLFVVSTSICAILIIWLLPNTNGLSLQDIQDLYNSKSKDKEPKA